LLKNGALDGRREIYPDQSTLITVGDSRYASLSYPACMSHRVSNMNDFIVGGRIIVKLTGGRIVEATIKAVVQRAEGVRLQVSFGDETALIYLWQVVEKVG
jgi:hypothetical protein